MSKSEAKIIFEISSNMYNKTGIYFPEIICQDYNKKLEIMLT